MKKELLKDLKRETKKRLLKTKKEFSKEPSLKVFENTENYNQIIIQTGVPFTANCEHHHIAFAGQAHIAYIANKWLLGLSKLARIIEKHLNPTIYTIQEKATQQIHNTLERAVKPKGVLVILEANHGCITYRGVKKPSLTITSSVSGVFADKEENAKSEALELIKLSKM